MDHTLLIEGRVDDFVSRITLKEKASQMFIDAYIIPRLKIHKYNWWSGCFVMGHFEVSGEVMEFD